MRSLTYTLMLLGPVCLTQTGAHASERDVQFSTIFGDSSIVAIRNMGSDPISLTGWRLCTQNSTSGAMMTDPGTLDCVVVPGHSAIIIRYQNDAIPSRPTHFNASDFGDIAPFELDAYAMSLFFPDANGEIDFTNPDLMADHIQWKRNHIPDTFETLCSPIAQDAGLWVDASEWIYVRVHMYLIELFDEDPDAADSPDDYNVILECRADLSDDGLVDFFDVSAFIGYFVDQDPLADYSGDGTFNFFDVSIFLDQFNQGGCPNF